VFEVQDPPIGVAPRCSPEIGVTMYIGIGTVLLVLIIVLLVMMMRGRRTV
jgi:hypothetical protein